MSAPATRTAPVAIHPVARAWWLVLPAALALLGVATARRLARVDAITQSPTWSVDAPARDAASPTGYAGGARALVVPGHHNPSFWWIMEAQQAAAEGRLRLRHIDYDARPGGREIRRTALFRWWLTGTGWLRGAIEGEPLGYAIERGALVAGPLLFALLLVGGTLYCARFFSPWSAMGFAAGGIALFPLAADFPPGAPDPHALAWVLALGSILPLLAPAARVAARPAFHFAAAGIFGGLGFWNDPTSQAPVLLGIVLAVLGSRLLRRRRAGSAPPPPLPWRAWAGAGALMTLGAAVFEFAPHHFSLSLGAVHPVHALAWWGLGELLHAADVWSRAGRGGFSARARALAGGGVLAAAAWPVLAWMGDSGTLLAADFHALELANHPRGGIAPGLGAWLRRADGGASAALLLPLGLLLAGLWRIFPGQAGPEERDRLGLILLTALVAAGLAVQQLRWWNLFDVLALALLATLLAGDGLADGGWRSLVVMPLVLPGLLVGFPPSIPAGAAPEPTPLETQALIARDFSCWLAKRGRADPIVLFSTPAFSTAAAYYGGFDVVVSGDGGNQAGHLAAVRIASAVTPQEGRILLSSRAITHIALPLWDPMIDQLVRMGTNLPPGQPLPRGAFAVALRDWYLPLWLQPLDYLIPAQPQFREFELRAFALVPEQEPDLGLSRLADFFVQRGQLAEARLMREALTAYPRSLPALGAVAGIDLALRDRTRLREGLDTLVPLLSRRIARNLPADRRISLASLFMDTNQPDLARGQLTATLADLDGATLRNMTPGTLVNLLSLSRALDLPLDPALANAARELLPPGVRSQLGL